MVKVADFIADFLFKKGITDIFMLSGGGAIHLDEAVAQHSGLREICIKNEATGPMMAEAYARIKNNFGVVYVTTGPGGANAVTGVVECFVDSSPVLIISGQAPINQTTRHAGIPNLRSFGIQELNIIEVVKPITKYATMVTKPESILYELEKAISIAKYGRPGPVWLDIPLDVQSAIIDENKLYGYIHWESSGTLQENYDIINQKTLEIADALLNSKRPLIVAGQGIKNSGTIFELKELADKINCPIMLSRLGLDCLPYSYDKNMGIGGLRGSMFNKRIMQEADVILSVGTSLSVAFAGYDLSFFNSTAKIYMVDIDPAEIEKIRPRLTSAIISDAKSFLISLINNLHSLQAAHVKENESDWLDHCVAYKNTQSAKVFAKEQNPIDIYYLAKKVDELSSSGDIYVDDAGSIYYVAGQTLTFENGTRELTSGAYASMGLAIPLSIGAAIADPSARILTMTGDGSLETNVQELKTLSYYNLNVKLFVINNGGYISMRDHGRCTEDEQNTMLNLRKVAAAYDMPYYLINDYRQFDTYVPEFINKRGPAFIEVICDSNQKLILPL